MTKAALKSAAGLFGVTYRPPQRTVVSFTAAWIGEFGLASRGPAARKLSTMPQKSQEWVIFAISARLDCGGAAPPARDRDSL